MSDIDNIITDLCLDIKNTDSFVSKLEQYISINESFGKKTYVTGISILNYDTTGSITVFYKHNLLSNNSYSINIGIDTLIRQFGSIKIKKGDILDINKEIASISSLSEFLSIDGQFSGVSISENSSRMSIKSIINKTTRMLIYTENLCNMLKKILKICNKYA